MLTQKCSDDYSILTVIMRILAITSAIHSKSNSVSKKR